MFGPYGDKLFHLTGYNQIHPGTIFIIGKNTGGFFHLSTAISFGIDFQGDFTLAAGGDLSRKRDSRTTSAGFYAIHIQHRISLILDDKVVYDGGIFQHRGEFMMGLRGKNMWCRIIFGTNANCN
jgi:hypothetical protein